MSHITQVQPPYQSPEPSALCRRIATVADNAHRAGLRWVAEQLATLAYLVMDEGATRG